MCDNLSSVYSLIIPLEGGRMDGWGGYPCYTIILSVRWYRRWPIIAQLVTPITKPAALTLSCCKN
jgi:hypothetical protein